MEKQSIAKNYFFQFSYQVLVLVIPLILSPYLTRTLKDTALGTYTFINTNGFYFVVLANLGIGVYGKRAVSRIVDDENELRKTFWSLFYVHVITSFISFVLYILFIFLFAKEDCIIYLLNSFYVLSALFDITWLFYGLENFSSVVIKNTIIKLCVCICIFAFVKSPNDLWKYTLISSLGICIGQIVMIPQALKFVKPIRVCKKDCICHIKPILIFSVAIIASSLYTVFDKTLLGLLSRKEVVAYYEYSNQIIMVPQTFVGVIGTVMFPRACKLVSIGETDEQKRLMNVSFMITAFIGMGAIFGLISIAKMFSIIYFGESFSSCGNIMIALSPLVYIVGAGSIVRSQCLIPNGMDKQFNLSIIYNAVINIILSVVFIPIIGVYGAIIGTLSAEIFGFFYQINLGKELFDRSIIYKSVIPFSVIGIMMLGVIKFINLFFDFSVKTVVVDVLVGGGFYCVLSFIFLYYFNDETEEMIKDRIKRYKR